MIDIYGLGSTRSMRAVWAAKEAGLDYTYQEINLKEGEHKSESFLCLNPYGKVPALKNGDFVLWESAAILGYIADLAPEGRLAPKASDLEARATMNKWMHFANCEIDALLFTIEKHIWRYPEEERLPQVIEKTLQELQGPLGLVTDHLKKNEFLMGEQFTVADILMAHCLNWARFRGAYAENDTLVGYTKKLSKREFYPRELYKKD